MATRQPDHPLLLHLPLFRSRTAVAPLERLKILMQVQGSSQRAYTGVVQGVWRMYRDEGLRGMFKGNGANCARIVPNSAVKFLCYENFAHVLSDRRLAATGDGRLSPLTRLVAGAGAGVVAMSATYPLDMVRGRLTVQEGATTPSVVASAAAAAAGPGPGSAAAASSPPAPRPYRGMVDATVRIVAEEGPRALYRGWVPSVLGVVPYVGLNFAVYETLKDQLTHANGLLTGWTSATNEAELSVALRLACGAVAGTTGQTVAYPFDVARRRLQVTGWQGSQHLVQGEAEAHHYRGMVDCFRKMVKHEGGSSLFKGLWANYVKVVPSIAIAFVSYEQIKRLFGVATIITS